MIGPNEQLQAERQMSLIIFSGKVEDFLTKNLSHFNLDYPTDRKVLANWISNLVHEQIDLAVEKDRRNYHRF